MALYDVQPQGTSEDAFLERMKTLMAEGKLTLLK